MGPAVACRPRCAAVRQEPQGGVLFSCKPRPCEEHGFAEAHLNGLDIPLERSPLKNGDGLFNSDRGVTPLLL